MSDSKGSLQWEGSTDSNLSAGQFLCEIDNKIDERSYTTERQKVNCLRNNIAFGSAADEWFNKLTIDDKDTYEHLTDAFELQWPLTTAPRASKAERIATLKEWVLKPDELGKKVEGPGGVMMWSHVKWATGLASRVRDAEDTTGFLLSEVYNALPKPVRDLIRKEPRTTYTELTTAVLALDNVDLKDAAADYTCNEETARLAREPASPTKAIREALAGTHFHPQPQYRTPPPNIAHSSNPFGTIGRRGNLFGPPRNTPLAPFRGVGPGALGMGRGMRQSPVPRQSLRDRPAAIRHQDLIRFALPHHPNTPDGLTAYRAQVATWHAANPGIQPDEQHPYPLSPGKPPAGSRECWGCGLQGHMKGAPVCEGETLPDYERTWRAIAGSITRQFGRERLADTQHVNYVNYTQHAPYGGYSQYYDDNADDGQGNGEGLSA